MFNSDNLALTETYKAYRNALNRLRRLAKRNYYHSVLNEHKGNSQKVWQVVNKLASVKNRRLLPSYCLLLPIVILSLMKKV